VADDNILAGMTAEQADADIAARQAKIQQLEATLKGAKENLKAAQKERQQLDELAGPSGDGVVATAGTAEAEGGAQ
jgi:multidrug resistance efflux pump